MALEKIILIKNIVLLIAVGFLLVSIIGLIIDKRIKRSEKIATGVIVSLLYGRNIYFILDLIRQVFR